MLREQEPLYIRGEGDTKLSCASAWLPDDVFYNSARVRARAIIGYLLPANAYRCYTGRARALYRFPRCNNDELTIHFHSSPRPHVRSLPPRCWQLRERTLDAQETPGYCPLPRTMYCSCQILFRFYQFSREFIVTVKPPGYTKREREREGARARRGRRAGW